MSAVAQTVLLSIVSPVYGCKGCLEDLVERICAVLPCMGIDPNHIEIILVDDASPDGAWSRIEELSQSHPFVRGLKLSRNFGQHAAITAGLEYAKGRRVVVMDCDLQDVPEEIPRLVEALDAGAEIALAQRIDRQDSSGKRLGSWAFYRILGWLTESSYDHTTANFGAYDRKVIDVIREMPESDRFFPLLVRWTGFRTTLVPVNHAVREHGTSGYNLRRLIKLAMNVAMSFSDKPLRLVVKTGMLFAAVALCVVVFSLYRYSSGDIQVAGFTSVIASIWLVGSVILSSIGIVGLYLGRLYNHAKNRPHFVVAEYAGLKENPS